MLYGLKNEIKRQEMNELILEGLAKVPGEDMVKSAFLDSIDIDVVGAETDPKIKELVASIPEYDNHDDELEKKINAITESLIETEI